MRTREVMRTRDEWPTEDNPFVFSQNGGLRVFDATNNEEESEHIFLPSEILQKLSNFLNLNLSAEQIRQRKRRIKMLKEAIEDEHKERDRIQKRLLEYQTELNELENS